MSVCPYEKPCGKKPCDDGGKCPKDTEQPIYVPYKWPYYPDRTTGDPYPPYYPTITWCGAPNSTTTCTVTWNTE